GQAAAVLDAAHARLAAPHESGLEYAVRAERRLADDLAVVVEAGGLAPDAAQRAQLGDGAVLPEEGALGLLSGRQARRFRTAMRAGDLTGRVDADGPAARDDAEVGLDAVLQHEGLAAGGVGPDVVVPDDDTLADVHGESGESPQGAQILHRPVVPDEA